ncbi:MAG: peptidase M49 [Acidobacteria bacterium]|nr:peptidase M49 [Acidobacteriota bacterium]
MALGLAVSQMGRPAMAAQETTDRQYLLETIGDAAVVQLYADGFEELSLRDKTLIWHLYQAALAGRDIYYDQRYEHNLAMREVLEEIITHPSNIAPRTLDEIRVYTKLFWLNTGPFNNLTARKFTVNTTPAEFKSAVVAAGRAGAVFPTLDDETVGEMVDRMIPLFFDPDLDPIVTNKTPGPGQDLLLSSANNLYKGVSLADLEGFDERYPLTSRLVKVDEELIEEVYRVGGRYSREISEIITHLEAAIPYASAAMARALRANIAYYRTGSPVDQRAYDIAWVEDQSSSVDTINGFTEVYMDARGAKGAWEALVFYVNPEKTGAIQTLAANAQWFEDRMPWNPQYRKEGVVGITANAIDVVVETGDSGPVTPIGINLPNDQTVREQYGSKSVSLSNVNEAYDGSSPANYLQEFAWTEDEVERSRRWGSLGAEMTTNMHEVIGHASGKLAERLGGTAQPYLKEHYSALEEARADLVGLYFLPDPKLAELGVLPVEAQEDVVRARYEGYTRNALLQLRRIRTGTQIEQDHMRNRQMIVHWLIANTAAIEKRVRDGKSFYVMVDSMGFREGVARLLGEVQRIKSEGDYEAARDLFETHGIHFEPELRDEVIARIEAVGLPSYSGFVQPRLEPVRDSEGGIIDVEISYPQDLTSQMLEYSGKLSKQ